MFKAHNRGQGHICNTEERKNGSVLFGNDADNVLLIKNMKHNLLSVSRMCDQGHTFLFNSKKCEIRKEGSRILVEKSIRNPNNIYILNEIGKEICFLGKEDESWIWHRRMGHMRFNNIVKISRKEVVREILEISNLANIMCKHC